jgi:hypothetical protein
MMHPVHRCILSEREGLDLPFVNAIIQMKEKAETHFGEKGVSWLRVNIEVEDMFCICNAIRGQIFLHREM